MLPNHDLDTGKPPAPGTNPLVDDTYTELLAKLAEQKFSGISPELRRAINTHYALRGVPHSRLTASGASRNEMQLGVLRNATQSVVRGNAQPR